MSPPSSHPHPTPLHHHWAHITAFKVYQAKLAQQPQEHPDSFTPTITVASGITPSGTVHIGNFREVVSAYFVALALTKLGAKVRFIYSWDSFDSFRKVPANLDSTSAYTAYLGQPICDIPDPKRAALSYAHAHMERFEAELGQCGIHPEFIYQHKMYRSGAYTDLIRTALTHTPQIKTILNAHRKEPLSEHWWPIICYCPDCSKDTVTIEAYHPPNDLRIACSSCSHRSTQSLIDNQGIKLTWRVDWPMRWHYESVDFEPGGKDHSSQGGSFDTAKKIATTLFDQSPPHYLGYDFVMVKHSHAKMSSSSGNVVSLGECLNIYEPEMIHFLFAAQRPNHDFSFGLGEDVLRVYEEYDAAIATIVAPPPEEPKPRKRYHGLKVICELAHAHLLKAHDDPTQLYQDIHALPAFRGLANQLQVMERDIPATITRFYPDQRAGVHARLHSRLTKVLHWLENYADDKFVIRLNTSPPPHPWSAAQLHILHHTATLLERYELSELDSELIHKLIYHEIIHPLDCDPQLVFTTIYQALINQDRGPKLAYFLHTIGSEKALSCLRVP